MGTGSWTSRGFADYTISTKCVASVDDFVNCSNVSTQDVFKVNTLSDSLNPYKIMRECRDSDEHPNTLPVILALDVTGSMGSSAVAVAKQLGKIMESIYSDEAVPDVEFCMMAIGDLAYDAAPIQMGQFESDIRIAEQLDAIYFEGHGGGNNYESYTAAWYMGLNHCDLDCWKRGRKGIIITLGDELPNPYLPKSGRSSGLAFETGDKLQGDVETTELLPQVREKFDVYHISVNDRNSSYEYNNRTGKVDAQWRELLGENNYFVCGLNDLGKTISNIVTGSISSTVGANNSNEVSW